MVVMGLISWRGLGSTGLAGRFIIWGRDDDVSDEAGGVED